MVLGLFILIAWAVCAAFQRSTSDRGPATRQASLPERWCEDTQAEWLGRDRVGQEIEQPQPRHEIILTRHAKPERTDSAQEETQQPASAETQQDRREPEGLADNTKKRGAQDAKDKAEKKRFAKETEAYRTAKTEYDAAVKLKLARTLANEGKDEKGKGHAGEPERLLEMARGRYQEIVKDYPDTAAAKDAQQLLAGAKLAGHDLPPVPVPPAPRALSSQESQSADASRLLWVVVEGEDLLQPDEAPSGTSWTLVEGKGASQKVPVYRSRVSDGAPERTQLLVKAADARLIGISPPDSSWTLIHGTGTPKTVFVHGYFRRDGTYVRSHFRSPPGSLGLGSHSSRGHSSRSHSAGGGRRR